MASSLTSRLLHIAVAAISVVGPVAPAAADTAPVAVSAVSPAGVEVSLADARERIKSGDYDGAIGLLKQTSDQARSNPSQLRETYLLLIKTHVFQGNDYKFKPQGRTASDLSYGEARRLTEECLRTHGLEHTRPVPEAEYPPEMHRLFEDVRKEIFGSLRVREVTPADATVFLDADTLGTLPGEEARGAVDVPSGIHLVTVERAGYETITDRIVIAPGSTLERNYTMVKRRGTGWYASRIGIGLAVVGGLAIALASGDSGGGDETPQPLPGPPPPPGALGR